MSTTVQWAYRTLCALGLCFCALLWAADSAQVSSFDKVYVNQANAQELAQYLDGIGQSKAEAIVAYREAHGPFTDLQSLKAVKGVGDKTLEKNASRLVFEPARPKEAAVAQTPQNP